MKEQSRIIVEELFERYPQLSCERERILKAFDLILQTYLQGGTLFVCGNGGSASDSEHIVGELMKSFKKKRPVDSKTVDALLGYGEEGKTVAQSLEGALPCISLTSHISLSTAYANDTEPCATFAQQLYGLGKRGDALICISTSGNSKNCVYATYVAKAKEIKTVAFTGRNESKLSALCDCAVQVPETETFKVQELHLPVYHALCAFLEAELF